MKKILVFMNSFNFGGITSLMQDIYRSIDKDEYYMSFIRLNWNINSFDDEIVSNGNKVYYYDNESLGKMPIINYIVRRKHMVKRICGAVGDDKYDIAYIHANAGYCVPAAKKLGIPKIIMHSHEGISDFGGNEKKSVIISLIWKNRLRMYNRLVDYKVGDSKKACIAKFGERVVNDPAMRIIHPPINIEKFTSSKYNRDSVIKEFGIDISKFNMIHVGRLSNVKNQPFMVDILSEMLKTRPCNLYIIGDGDSSAIIKRAKELNVENNLFMLPGNTSAGIYTAMDCSLLPSFSEAFGMVAVESQLMGVPCFASTNVPEDVNIGMCTFIDLNSSAAEWSRMICGYDYKNNAIDTNAARNFDVNCTIQNLKELFR